MSSDHKPTQQRKQIINTNKLEHFDGPRPLVSVKKRKAGRRDQKEPLDDSFLSTESDPSFEHSFMLDEADNPSISALVTSSSSPGEIIVSASHTSEKKPRVQTADSSDKRGYSLTEIVEYRFELGGDDMNTGQKIRKAKAFYDNKVDHDRPQQANDLFRNLLKSGSEDVFRSHMRSGKLGTFSSVEAALISVPHSDIWLTLLRQYPVDGQSIRGRNQA
jgi:hypothetical protein